MSPNIKNSNGITPVCLSVVYGAGHIRKMLLQNGGVDINAQSPDDQKMLVFEMRRAISDNASNRIMNILKFAPELLDDGVGEDILHYAAEKCTDKTITHFLNKFYNKAQDWIDVAFKSGNADTVYAMLKSPDITFNPEDFDAYSNDLTQPILKKIMEKEDAYDILTNSNGRKLCRSILDPQGEHKAESIEALALRAGNVQLAKIFLNTGPEQDNLDFARLTPELLSNCNSEETKQTILSAAMKEAIIKNNVDAVQALIKAGIDLDRYPTSPEYTSFLHYAVIQPDSEPVIKLLIDAGANPNKSHDSSVIKKLDETVFTSCARAEDTVLTAMDVAVLLKKIDVIQILLNGGGCFNQYYPDKSILSAYNEMHVGKRIHREETTCSSDQKQSTLIAKFKNSIAWMQEYERKEKGLSKPEELTQPIIDKGFCFGLSTRVIAGAINGNLDGFFAKYNDILNTKMPPDAGQEAETYNKLNIFLQQTVGMQSGTGRNVADSQEQNAKQILDQFDPYNPKKVRDVYFFKEHSKLLEWAQKAKAGDALDIRAYNHEMDIYVIENPLEKGKNIVGFYDPNSSSILEFAQESLRGLPAEFRPLKPYYSSTHYPVIICQEIVAIDNLNPSLGIEDSQLNDEEMMVIAGQFLATGNHEIFEKLKIYDKAGQCANYIASTMYSWYNTEALEALIDNGNGNAINWDKRDEKGITLLHKVISNIEGNYGLFEKIVNILPSVSWCVHDKYGNTPLYYAAKLGKYEVAKILQLSCLATEYVSALLEQSREMQINTAIICEYDEASAAWEDYEVSLIAEA